MNTAPTPSNTSEPPGAAEPAALEWIQLPCAKPRRMPSASRWPLLIGISIAMLPLIGLIVGTGVAVYRTFGPVVLWITLALVVALITVLTIRGFRRSAQRHTERIDAAAKAHASARAFAESISGAEKPPPEAEWLERYAKAIAGNFGSGQVVIFAPPDRMLEPEPILYPFEPTPLNEAPLELTADGVGPQREQALAAHRSKRPKLAWWKSLHLPAAANTAGAIVLVIFALRGLQELLETGRLGFYGFGSAVILGPYLWQRLTAGSHVAEHILGLPGGLLLRSPHGKGWRLHVFDAGTSTLVLSPQTEDFWQFAVADAEQAYRGLIDVNSAHFLLSAWASTAPRPPLERFEDLR